jgi:hypothetical protein
LSFANDNSNWTKIYSELLHIIGLTEVKEGGKTDRTTKRRQRNLSLLRMPQQIDSLDKISRLQTSNNMADTQHSGPI